MKNLKKMTITSEYNYALYEYIYIYLYFFFYISENNLFNMANRRKKKTILTEIFTVPCNLFKKKFYNI